jgi:hypothetical protein
MRNLVSLLGSEWRDLEQQIIAMNTEIEQIASSDPACQRLRQIPGVGPLVATAIVAAIGNGAAFHKGREFPSWLGLVPRQHSTGGKARLFGISKRGNSYLRKTHSSLFPCSQTADHTFAEWTQVTDCRSDSRPTCAKDSFIWSERKTRHYLRHSLPAHAPVAR